MPEVTVQLCRVEKSRDASRDVTVAIYDLYFYGSVCLRRC